MPLEAFFHCSKSAEMTMNLKCVSEWDRCLPQPDELTPLSQKLIPHELACAFNILPSSSSSTCTVATPAADVLNASHSAFKSLLEIRSILMPCAESERERDAETVPHLYQNKFDDEKKFQDTVQAVKEGSEDNLHVVNLSPDGRFAGGLTTGPISFCSADDDFASASLLAPRIAAGLSQLMYGATYSSDSRIPESTIADLGHPNPLLRDGGTGISVSILEAANLMQLKVDPSDDTDSIPSMDFFQGSSITVSNEEQSARIPKKPRLVWTPQLHKRFVDAVAYLGIKQAVPKTIMQRMNVDGLTRENVASHLQKYRLYLKRAQGFANGGPSISDQLFASTPVPPSLAASPHYLVSHHSQHVDHSFGSVHSANLQSHLGHPAHQNTSSISSPTPPFSGFNCLPSFSMIQRAQVPPPLINSELGRENYIPQRSSAQGQVLSLFPNSSK